MARKRSWGQRGRREPKQRRGKRQPPEAPEDPMRYAEHPRYGRVPLLPEEITLPNGQSHTLYRWDPNYAPPLPAGAVRGDIRKQLYGIGVPHYYYVDDERVCVQCRQHFVFGAREQKFWYETLGFNRHSTAVRCLRCRKRRRSAKALHRQVGEAREALQAHPQDPLAHLALAEALVTRHERLRTGKLAEALGAARKAGRLDPSLFEALYWEGAAQDALGQQAKADVAYRAFLERAAGVRRCRARVRRARRRLGLEE